MRAAAAVSATAANCARLMTRAAPVAHPIAMDAGRLTAGMPQPLKVPLRSLKRSSGAGALVLPVDAVSVVSDEELPHRL